MSQDVISRPSPDTSFTDHNKGRSNLIKWASEKRMSVDIYPKPEMIPDQQHIQSATATTDPSSATVMDDTVHYMSPASPISVRTVHEGDYNYESPSFMRLLQQFGRVEEYVSTRSSTISCVEPELQRTLAFVRPEAMEYKDVILRAVNQAGFSIIRSRTVHLTPEQVSEIYSQHYGSPSFPYAVVSVSVGPILVLSLAGINAVAKWRDLVGPEKTLPTEWFYPRSMRLRFGLVNSIPNALHASETLPEANKENRYFNPESILEPVITQHEKVYDYCSLYINPTLLNGLTEVVRTKPLDPILYLAEWLLLNNPFQPRFPSEVALTKT